MLNNIKSSEIRRIIKEYCRIQDELELDNYLLPSYEEEIELLNNY